jgi:hypothetical protein
MPALKVFYRSAVLALSVAALMAVILVVIPDGNDYAKVSIDKHERLENMPGKKVVFVGGSSLAYGLDSKTVEQATGYAVVNMGMNAFVGVRFLLDEVDASLKAGDVVVLSIDNDAFRIQEGYDGVEGRTEDLLMMVKVRPAAWQHTLPWSRRKDIVAAVPGVVHRKAIRLIDSGVRSVAGKKLDDSLDALETRAGFNTYGDLVSHINVTWKGEREKGLDLRALKPNERVIPVLREYYERWTARGVRVFIAPPPIPVPYFEEQKEVITRIRADVDRALPGAALAPLERYVFPDSCFFDNVHHLNGECRMKQSKLLAEDLARTLGVTPKQSRL